MCRGGLFPQSGGGIIASLKDGDEIILEKDYGYPKAKEDSKQIIIFVSGFSALTATGIKLSCGDGFGITPTGRKFEDFEISEKAKKILEEILK